MRVSLVNPDHYAYQEMIALSSPEIHFDVAGVRFRERNRLRASAGISGTLLAKVLAIGRRTSLGTMASQSAKIRMLRLQVPDGASVHVCGGLWHAGQRWIGDYENSNVLSFYDPAVLAAKGFVAYLTRRFSDESCRCIRVWSDHGRRSFEAVFTSESIRRKVQVVCPTLAETHEIRDRAESSTPRLLFVGRGYWIKGGDIFLAALRRLRRRGVAFQADYVGDVTDEAVPLLADLGSSVTVFREPLSRNELFRRFYSQADIFVMLGMADSYGLAVIEAMSFGLPVVAFRLHSGLSEIVGDSGGGLLVEPESQLFDRDGLHTSTAADLVIRLKTDRQTRSVDAVEAALEELIHNHELRRNLGKKGHQSTSTGRLSPAAGRSALSAMYRGAFGPLN